MDRLVESCLAKEKEILLAIKEARREPRRSTRSIVKRQDRCGRNDPCLCGSGRKYKICCRKDDYER